MLWGSPSVRGVWRCGVVVGLVMIFASCSGGGSSSPPPATQANLPPDPGPAGMATLAGIDSNNNGVRDDIERYIALTYPSPTDAKARGALTQYAIALQKTLVDSGEPVATQTHVKEELAAIACLLSIKTSHEAADIWAALHTAFLNTDARTQAYFAAEKQVLASSVTMPQPSAWSSSCASL